MKKPIDETNKWLYHRIRMCIEVGQYLARLFALKRHMSKLITEGIIDQGMKIDHRNLFVSWLI